jgi:hypothetical protein
MVNTKTITNHFKFCFKDCTNFNVYSLKTYLSKVDLDGGIVFSSNNVVAGGAEKKRVIKIIT